MNTKHKVPIITTEPMFMNLRDKFTLGLSIKGKKKNN